MCRLVAESLVLEGRVPLYQVLPASTGVIGHFLPMDKIRVGIPRVIAQLSNSADAGNAFAEGILTTDLVKKTALETVTVGGRGVSR